MPRSMRTLDTLRQSFSTGIQIQIYSYNSKNRAKVNTAEGRVALCLQVVDRRPLSTCICPDKRTRVICSNKKCEGRKTSFATKIA